jgi:hypothetical protein
MSKTDKTHDLYCQKLKKIGTELGFHATIGSKGKMYHMGKPDCVWYYKCDGKEPLLKIAKGDKIKCNCGSCKAVSQYLPFVAFEVPNSEDEKGLRGSLMTLQLTNASAGIIVLTGKSEREHKKYTGKLIGRYSYMRTRIWTKEYVDDLYKRLVENKIVIEDAEGHGKLKASLKQKYNIVLGQLSLDNLQNDINKILKSEIRVSGRSSKTGEKVTTDILVKDIL